MSKNKKIVWRSKYHGIKWVIIFACYFFANFSLLSAQELYINEIQSSNLSTLYDHTGDTPDWMELYNKGMEAINLEGYGLSDVDTIPLKWQFPAIEISPNGYLLVHASGLNLKEPILFWETIIDQGDSWSYTVPTSELPSDWADIGFDDASWHVGKSGFGYGDDDDSTVINTTMSVFLRKKFTITNKENVQKAYLHIDFDDAFVAYLNGVEFARSNIGQTGVRPAFDQGAHNYDHEAKLYRGEDAEAYLIYQLSQLLAEGENVLAVQVHNHSLGSSDLTAIPMLTLGKKIGSEGNRGISEYINFVPKGLHTNFKISSAGEHLILSDRFGMQIDSVFTGSISSDISLGRKPDGTSTFRMFSEPTPGRSNTPEGYSSTPVPLVTFTMPGGIHQVGFSLELTAGSNDSIYYTLDGSEPKETDNLYAQPMLIFSDKVVRARVIRHDHLPGTITTQNYVIGKSHQVPVVFVNTDPENLWDYETGIYVKGPNAEDEFPFFGANFWQDWERPANVAMYETDGQLAFQLDAGIKIFGAWSKGHDQKSLSIHAHKSMGTEQINYKLFNELNIDQFKTFLLRNSGNDYNNTMLRDAFCNRVTASLGLEQQAYRPSVVYLNGEYWGIHNIREKVNEEFLASHYAIDEDNIDLLELEGVPVRGNSEHYDALRSFMNANSLGSTGNYEYVKTQMDVDNFIKYQVAEIFIDNRDWPGNNIKFWRERTNYGRWRWIMFDSDFGFNTWGDDNQNFNTLEYALDPNGPGWPNPPWSTFMLRKLMENTSFKHDFINCFADNLNTIFVPKVMRQVLHEMKAVIQPEIGDHFSRWYGSINYWNDRIRAMETFIDQRQAKVRSHIMWEFGLPGMFQLELNVQGNGTIDLNKLHVTEFPWTGQYYQNVPVQLDPIPDPGYRFVEWQGIDYNGQEHLSIESDQLVSLTAVFEATSISNGQVVINEINYSSSETFDAGDWVELLNVSNRSINISGWVLKDQNDANSYIFPSGTIIEAHGYIVVCRNRIKFLTSFPTLQPLDAELEFGLSSSGDCVRLFDDGGTLMDEVCYENSAPWPEATNGLGPTLALVDAYSNNAHPANWKSSMHHGTPGKKNLDVITGLSDDLTEGQELIAHVFPNPFHTNATVLLKNIPAGEVSMNMTDLTGKVSYLQDVDLSSNDGNGVRFNIDRHTLKLAPGIYILAIESKSYTKHIKVILQ